MDDNDQQILIQHDASLQKIVFFFFNLPSTVLAILDFLSFYELHVSCTENRATLGVQMLWKRTTAIRVNRPYKRQRMKKNNGSRSKTE